MLTKLKNFFTKLFEAFRPKTRVPWNLCVVAMDGANRTEHVDIPLKEAISFLEQYSRFKFNVTVIETNVSHTLNEVILENGNKTYLMLRDNIPQEFRESLPVADSYLFLYSTRDEEGNFRDPFQGGSTMGVPDGIPKGGKNRPYATVCWDVRWYGNWPAWGFNSQAAQIVVHEINNCINCVTAWTPYNCTPFDISGGPSAYDHERVRIQTLKNDCYKKLLNAITSVE